MITIANKPVGHGHPTFIIAEIGINHNGNIALAKLIIDAAKEARVDAVKFQKRTPELCVPDSQKNLIRDHPQWGQITYLEYKKRIELSLDAYREIDQHCKSIGMPWFSSCWDEPSLEFMDQFHPPCYKVASACITNEKLLKRTREIAGDRPIIMSTGMSTIEQIDQAVKWIHGNNLVLLHTTSAYPAQYSDLNLKFMDTLRNRYGHAIPVGYSGHETGLASTTAAVARGACMVERHITIDRSLWGTDQAASLQPSGFRLLVRDIRIVEESLGNGIKKVTEAERVAAKKLRL